MPSSASFGQVVSAAAAGGPQTTLSPNGYSRRRIWTRPGAYTFTAEADGKIKYAVFGAGSAGSLSLGGNGGALSIGEVAVTKGQAVTLTVGLGGKPAATPGNGGASALVTGGTTVVANGATYGENATAAAASGGTISNTNGGVNFSQCQGGASSGTPWGNGFASGAYGYGGAGWGGEGGYNASGGGTFVTYGGGGSHGRPRARSGGPGLTQTAAMQSSLFDSNGKSAPWWDVLDFDGSGGCQGTSVSNGQSSVLVNGGTGGVGAGGGCGQQNGCSAGEGGFGGGGGWASDTQGPGGRGGFGGGGGANNNGATFAGAGGDGAIIIWYNT